MASKSGLFLKWHGEPADDGGGQLAHKISQLRRQIHAERMASVKEKIEINRNKVENDVCQILSTTSKDTVVVNMLSSRIEKPLSMLSGFLSGSGEKDSFVPHEVASYITAKLPCTERLPPYTTWIFLDKNQRMAEDQSVVGRRRIYYDQHGSEALICSDSEEDVTEAEEEKHDYSEGEDRIIWMAFEEHGCCEDVQRIISQQIGVTAEEVQDRYKFLKLKYAAKISNSNEKNEDMWINGLSQNKTLSAALDSLDNLFCRRCLLFDCRLHGCSQSLVFPSEKQVSVIEQGDKKPCGDQCHLQLRPSGNIPKIESGRNEEESCPEKVEPATSSVDEVLAKNDCSGIMEDRPVSLEVVTALMECNDERSETSTHLRYSDDLGGKRKEMEQEVRPTHNLDPSSNFEGPPTKVQKQIASDTLGESTVDHITEVTCASLIESLNHGSEEFSSCEDASGTRDQKIGPDVEVLISSSQLATSTSATDEEIMGCNVEEPMLTMVKAHEAAGQVQRPAGDLYWKPLERELYLKGVEVFGRNSCLIARNMLSGMKSCIEVSRFMLDGGVSSAHGLITAPESDDCGKSYLDRTNDQQSVPRTRLLRRKGRARKLKYSWKSAGHPSMWKRIADGKNMSCKQYTPCGCPSMCGKDCPCLQSETCCEKYCGCSKSCKNRFRGCHCAKSRCRSRQCPCFAAGRECDPDVCRNCWVSCGDGSLGEPPRRGEGQCGNMRLLLRQQQRVRWALFGKTCSAFCMKFGFLFSIFQILLAKSDVAGWGAFLKNSVNKNDYLGEYTGELISHREADKRGKIYDRANSSFLFDLNDQYVLDAYRKGDKLKFANHSSNPNCYAKVMLVAGDHRVGIFAKDRIEASEELFYDYRYGPDQAPAWARTPDGSRREDLSLNQGRAKKHQSH